MAFRSDRNAKRNVPGSTLEQASDLLLGGRDILNPFSVGVWTPPVDVCHMEDRVIVRAELPGIDQSDIALSFQGGNLRIQGLKKEPGQPRKLLCFYCLERRYGRFDRQIVLKGILNPRKSHACLEKGILTVEIPKLKDRRGEAVEIPIEKK
jgi:HSP20 family protein